MIKKIGYKTVACLCAVAVFFGSIVYKPQEVHAEVTLLAVLTYLTFSIGVPILASEGYNYIKDKWSGTTDIKVNADGSVDVSESQMKELKELCETYAQEQAGVYTYRNKSNYSSVRMWLAGFAKIDTSRFDVNVDTLDNGMSWVAWGINGHMGYITNAPVNGVWISPDASSVTFYNNTGNETVPYKSYKCDYDGYSDGQWYDNYSNFSFYGQGQYTGADHLAFTSIDSYKNWRGGTDIPVIPLTPTWTGGGVHIDKDTVNKLNTIDIDNDLGKELQLTITNNQDIDMDELQKMLDDLFKKYLDDNNIVYTQPDPDVPDDSSGADISSLLSTSFTYDGVGTCGSGSPCVLTFDNVPENIRVECNNNQSGQVCYMLVYQGDTSGIVHFTSGADVYARRMYLNWSEDGKTLSYYSNYDSACQLNSIGYTYNVTYYYENLTHIDPGSGSDLTETNTLLQEIRDKLSSIVTTVKKIYKQVIVGNVIDAIDALADIVDAAINALNEAGEDAAAIGGVSELIKTKFPFCLPFDAYALVCLLEAEPQTPTFEIPFVYTPLGLNETIVIDFTLFDEPIKYLRWLETFLFIWGLILLTPKMVLLLNSDKGGGNT